MSEQDNVPGKSETEIVIETFVDRMEDIHPSLDREELRSAVSGYVRDATKDADGEEESEEDSEGEEE